MYFLDDEKEEVVNEIGFFDAVRVSADSEYEYRIRAVFGEERVVFLNTPSHRKCAK